MTPQDMDERICKLSAAIAEGIRRAVERLEEEGRIFVLRPLIPTVSRLEKDYDTLMHFYEHGYKTMKKEYKALIEYLEA